MRPAITTLSVAQRLANKRKSRNAAMLTWRGGKAREKITNNQGARDELYAMKYLAFSGQSGGSEAYMKLSQAGKSSSLDIVASDAVIVTKKQ
jgi:hypothetical protein